jgi:hypothetical protein
MSRPNTICDILERLVICEPTTLKTGCWEYPGCKSGGGYAQVLYGGGRQRPYVHRLVYEHFVGPVPEGLETDHLCRNRSCANFEHLEMVTRQENNRRRKFVIATHCPAGHEKTEDNILYTKLGHRICKICRREQSSQSYRLKRAAR